MGFFISAMLSARGRAYLHETKGRGKDPCDNLYIACLVLKMQCFI